MSFGALSTQSPPRTQALRGAALTLHPPPVRLGGRSGDGATAGHGARPGRGAERALLRPSEPPSP